MADKKSSALSIVNTLNEKGFRALFAGGCVRDMLMGGEPGDYDIATSATPQQVASLFQSTVGVGEHFGVMVVVLEGIPFEVATFRSDKGAHDGRHPDSVVFTNEQNDAQRRDFTINGMFFDPATQEVLDYVDGRADLEKGILRAIGDADRRFEEDYLRMLRAVRFAARFGFSIDHGTWTAIIKSAPNILHISSERIFMELDKMVTGPSPELALQLLAESTLLDHILPEVAALEGIEQPPQFHPEGDVLAHTILTLKNLKHPSQILAWSALLHDIGKPATQTTSDRIRFNNHNRVGAAMAENVLRRLRAPNHLIEAVVACTDNHMNFINVAEMRMSTLKRFLARPTIADEIELHRADCLASHGDLSNISFLVKKRSELRIDEIKPVPLLSGRHLIALGFKPGPLFGEILHKTYDQQLEEKVTTLEEALTFVKKGWQADTVGPLLS